MPLIHEHLYTSCSRAEFYRFQMEYCFRDAKHCIGFIVKEVVTSRQAHRMTKGNLLPDPVASCITWASARLALGFSAVTVQTEASREAASLPHGRWPQRSLCLACRLSSGRLVFLLSRVSLWPGRQRVVRRRVLNHLTFSAAAELFTEDMPSPLASPIWQPEKAGQ